MVRTGVRETAGVDFMDVYDQFDLKAVTIRSLDDIEKYEEKELYPIADVSQIFLTISFNFTISFF